MSYSDRHHWASDVQTLNGATDLEVPFVFLKPVRIHRIGMKVTSADAGGAAVLFEDRTGASTDVSIETVTIPAADSDGELFWTDLDTTTSGGYLLEAGHILNLAVTESGTAPTAHALVEYSIEERADSALGSALTESA